MSMAKQIYYHNLKNRHRLNKSVNERQIKNKDILLSYRWLLFLVVVCRLAIYFLDKFS
jgi:hypothetical protein